MQPGLAKTEKQNPGVWSAPRVTEHGHTQMGQRGWPRGDAAVLISLWSQATSKLFAVSIIQSDCLVQKYLLSNYYTSRTGSGAGDTVRFRQQRCPPRAEILMGKPVSGKSVYEATKPSQAVMEVLCKKEIGYGDGKAQRQLKRRSVLK